MLSEIQNNFLRFLSFKFRVERIPYSKYADVEVYFKLPNLKIVSI